MCGNVLQRDPLNKNLLHSSAEGVVGGTTECTAAAAAAADFCPHGDVVGRRHKTSRCLGPANDWAAAACIAAV